MSISPGSHIGPYEVTSQLGEGGMGVVYRGRDSRLQRDVALKVLPDHFASDPDRLSRFQREAQVLASLNHSNIAQIYGLEQVGDATCIVMELVEGETLGERLKKGPMSSDEALDVARQIAEALAAAHERGIIHRDLKPANIKLTPNGTVKILDFGLAKAMAPRGSDTNMTAMPTMATASIVGSVVGTPGYMSPEQARGKEVDARTDIWAFGCVLYEMLTARQAFEGETITDVMAKIVTSSPDLDLLPKNTPPSIRMLLSSALNKNASQRLQHIGDARLFLDGSLAGGVSTTPEAATASKSRRGTIVIAALAAALAIAAVPAFLYFRNAQPQAGPQMRFELSVPGLVGMPGISPDGKMLAYVLQPQDGKRTLWIRPIGSDTAQQLSGTEDANGFLWSSDNRKILFTASGMLKRIDLPGGSPQPVAQIGGIRGADYRNGVILLARVSDNVISRVADTGGEITPITTLNPERKGSQHAVPVFLPDGEHFLYIDADAKLEDTALFVASLDGKETPARVMPLQPNRLNGLAYVPQGYLLLHNTGRLTAQRMDANGRAVHGEPIVLADDLEQGFSFSENGVLIYRKAAPVAGKQLQWFDRNGKAGNTVGAVENYGNLDLSPKGDRAAVDRITDGNRDIWVVDLERGVPLRVTFDRGSDWSASWSPDGGRLAFASSRDGQLTRIYEKSSTGSGPETALPPDNANSIPVHWSPDDKYIVFSRFRSTQQGGFDTWLLPLFGERKPMPYLESPFDRIQSRVSPDGRFVAFTTNESGTFQIVVQTFPDPNGGKWPISADGGVEPKWKRDGRELYYLSLDGKLMAVPINGPGFQPGRPAVLFQTPFTVNRANPSRDRRFDVTSDGRFLLVAPVAGASAPPSTVVVNWAADLEKK
jgi:Tol biopolymer transport system component